MKNSKLKTSVFALLLIGIFIISGCANNNNNNNNNNDVQDTNQETQNAIKIGFIGPLSGDLAKIGVPISKGAQLAQEELQQNGQRIEMIFEDGKCSGKEALTAYHKLTKVDGVDAVVVVCSPELLSIAPSAAQDNVLVMSPSATAPTITDAGNHVFRLAPSDKLQGTVAAQYIKEQNYNKVGVIYVNHDYGQGLNNVLKSELANKVALSEAFSQEDSDFRSQITKLKNKNVDVVYVVAFPKNAALILKQMTELGLDVPVVMAEAAKDPEVIPYADEDVVITVPLAQGTSYAAFEQKYTQKFGEAPKVFSAESYDTVQVIALAAQVNSNDLVASMQSVTSYDGAAGSITFDSNGDITKPYDFFTVRNGEFVKIR